MENMWDLKSVAHSGVGVTLIVHPLLRIVGAILVGGGRS